MQATAITLALVGLDAHTVHVEVDSGRGPTGFHLVGLPEASVREARVRVKAAIEQLGIDIAEYVLTINLSPADLKKSGGGFDLAMACGVLAALGRVDAAHLEGTVLLGELSLSGHLRPVRGVLPALHAASSRGMRAAIVPMANAEEAAAVRGIQVFVADTLSDVVRHLSGEAPLSSPRPSASSSAPPDVTDFAEVRGQPGARRALEIAAAGAHNVIMFGPPGAGKTMLARRVPTILPPLEQDEALTLTAIHSVSGVLSPRQGLLTARPFRAPHHTVSAVALVGGGSPVRAGEVSLAHEGCLFLDELLEFNRSVLEALRQPLEDGVVTIARARECVTFPARPIVVAAVNPCPCGYSPSPRCRCASDAIARYLARLSGPMLDRLDLQIRLSAVPIGELLAAGDGEASAAIRARVARARDVQRARFEAREVIGKSNTTLGPADLERVAGLDHAAASLVRTASDKLGLSARAYTKILRVSRTIADLEGSDALRAQHIAEAIHMRLPAVGLSARALPGELAAG